MGRSSAASREQIVDFAYQMPEYDSKLEELVRAFNGIWEDDDRDRLAQAQDRCVFVFPPDT